MGAEVLFEIAESVICVKIGLPVQAKKFSERINNAHNPLYFLTVLGRSEVNFKKVDCNNFTGICTMLEFTTPVLVLGIIYGFCEKTTLAGCNDEFGSVMFTIHVIVGVERG